MRSATTDELAAQHEGILNLRGGSVTALDGMVVASVVPSLTAGYRQLAQLYLDRPALVIGPGVRTGMPIDIDNPHELGADRIANAVAAHHRHGGPCVVVDFGTATNFDVVSAEGSYIGGAIAPGVEISAAALTDRAARLVKVDLVAPARVIGRSTVECLQSGIVFGTVAMVDGMVARIREEVDGAAVGDRHRRPGRPDLPVLGRDRPARAAPHPGGPAHRPRAQRSGARGREEADEGGPRGATATWP